MLKSKNVLVLMSGSIACYKVCTIISQLKQKGYSIKVVMSEAAQKFIGTATIEGLINDPPVTDMYQAGSVMEHIHLSRWADLVLLAPATANTINKIASGIGDDLVTTLFLAHDFQKPFLIAPAMNTKMYQHAVTQKSLTQLKNMGVEILETASGILACGEVGYGRLLEPELIIAAVESKIQSGESKFIEKIIPTIRPKKVLITSGGTQEPIDDVRVISNKSTGTTGAFLADQFISAGFDVTYMHSETAKKPILSCTQICFSSFSDLDTKLSGCISENKFDLIIHAAAVSDYSVLQTTSGKINSDSDTLTLQLKRNPKLINKIKKISPTSQLIGFKLTSSKDVSLIEKKISGLFEDANCDYVVHNEWATVKTGNTVFSLRSKQKNIANLDIDNLAVDLVKILLQKDTL